VVTMIVRADFLTQRLDTRCGLFLGQRCGFFLIHRLTSRV